MEAAVIVKCGPWISSSRLAGLPETMVVVQRHVNATHMSDDGQVSLLAWRRQVQLGW